MEVITKDDIRNYFTAWRNVRSDNRLSRGDLAIMDTIQDQKFEDIWFSYNTWAEKAGIERRQAIRCVKRLQELGYIQVMQKPDAKNTDTVHVIVHQTLRRPLRDDKEEDAEIGSLITKSEFNQEQNNEWGITRMTLGSDIEDTMGVAQMSPKRTTN
jgi:hypothetical protein